MDTAALNVLALTKKHLGSPVEPKVFLEVKP
jgi:hypothetical protein